MIILFFIILTLIIFSFIYIITGEDNELVKIKSDIDEKFYLVRNLGLHDEVMAADTIAEIKRRLTKLVKHIKKKYKMDPDSKFLSENFKVSKILETDITENDTSYSINKGETISLCIRDKDKDGYPIHDINTLMFVALHELAHLMTTSYGHDKEFTKNFITILKEANNIGIYTPIDYSANSKNYCGIKINKSPLY